MIIDEEGAYIHFHDVTTKSLNIFFPKMKHIITIEFTL